MEKTVKYSKEMYVADFNIIKKTLTFVFEYIKNQVENKNKNNNTQVGDKDIFRVPPFSTRVEDKNSKPLVDPIFHTKLSNFTLDEDLDRLCKLVFIELVDYIIKYHDMRVNKAKKYHEENMTNDSYGIFEQIYYSSFTDTKNAKAIKQVYQDKKTNLTTKEKLEMLTMFINRTVKDKIIGQFFPKIDLSIWERVMKIFDAMRRMRFSEQPKSEIRMKIEDIEENKSPYMPIKEFMRPEST